MTIDELLQQFKNGALSAEDTEAKIREHYFGESADAFRLVYQVGCVLALACYIIWGVQILWGS